METETLTEINSAVDIFTARQRGRALALELGFNGADVTLIAAAFIGMANNHSTHHRGQLAAYLRAMGSKVPPIYGDSADYPVQAQA